MFDPFLVDIRLAVTDTPPSNGKEVMVMCPRRDKHTDNTYSLAVYPANVHCYGCGLHLSRRYESLAFVLGMWDGKGDSKQAAVAASKVAHLYVGRPVVKQAKPIQPLDNSVALPYRINLWSTRRDRLDYLSDWRGISKETIDRARIGYDVSRFVLPVYNSCFSLLTLRYRIDEQAGVEGSKYTGMTGRNQTYLYPTWDVAKCLSKGIIDDLWIVEGELDVWPLLERGIPALTVTNGAQQVRNILPLIGEAFGRPLSQVCRRLVIATDQDQPGSEAALALGLACGDAGLSWVRASWGVGKDITEYLREGGRMEEITYAGVHRKLEESVGTAQAERKPRRPRSLLRPGLLA